MDFNLKYGRDVVRKFEKEKERKIKRGNVLVTFQVPEKLRKECMKKTANLSDYLRRCMEQLAKSDIDIKIKELHNNIIQEVIDDEKIKNN